MFPPLKSFKGIVKVIFKKVRFDGCDTISYAMLIENIKLNRYNHFQ